VCTELLKKGVTWFLDFSHHVVFQNNKTFSETRSTCCFLHNLQLYYFHKVTVTLLNDFQRKRNLAFRSSCHMIIDATGTLRMWRPLFNILHYNFRTIPRIFRLQPRSRREMRISGVSQNRAHLFWVTLNKYTCLRGSRAIPRSLP